MVIPGVHVIDNCDPTKLSEVAATHKRWEFLFMAAPMPFRRGTGSPVNPIAGF